MTAVAEPGGPRTGPPATSSRGHRQPWSTGTCEDRTARDDQCERGRRQRRTAPRQARFTGEIVDGGRSLAGTRTRLRHRTGVVTHAFAVPTKPGGQLTDPPASAGSGPVEQRCPRTRPVPWCTFVLVTGFTHSGGTSHGSVHSCTARPSRSAGPRPRPGSMKATSAGVSVKNRISSSRLMSGNDRSRSSSSSENTRVATRRASPSPTPPTVDRTGR